MPKKKSKAKKNQTNIALLIAIISAVSIIVVLVLYWMISPLFKNKTVHESLESIAQTSEESGHATSVSDGVNEISIKTMIGRMGEFEGLAGHDAAGDVSVYTADGKTYVRFEDGFEVTNGPDLFVHLGNNGSYDPEARLGELKGNIGSQNYEVPDGIDITGYNEVYVWCRAFSTPFGKAELK